MCGIVLTSAVGVGSLSQGSVAEAVTDKAAILPPSVMQDGGEDTLATVCGNATTPAATEWKPFAHKIEPGHFYTTYDEIANVRAWFLESRRCPRIGLKDMNIIRSVTYNCTKIDAVKGSMTIHAMPQYYQEIMDW